MQINREILNQFLAWKNAEHRKPLLLKGARQIGKSWAMEEFGKRHFLHYAVFNFDRQPELASAFQDSKSPDRILKELTLYTNVPLIAGETLLIFDEIQECESALNALKYFYEDAPEWHIIAAGSLLGVAVKQRKMTVPVGKVQIMRMYPLSFREFLYAADNATYQYIEDVNEIKHLPTIILNKLRLEYQRYLVCGGMPEVVNALLEGKGMQTVEQALQDILDLYELDFAKYAQARDIPRIRAVWHSLPSQLSKENRKFVYKLLKKGARSKDYEEALLWLED
ncbi:MAG: ATP-binding protein, partial [Paludibacteraceae bacterium]|nr:ATP-binding protein [Paludibacteraceae bacterium]